MRRFAAERDWDQFLFLKSLAIELGVEAAELLGVIGRDSGPSAALLADLIPQKMDELAMLIKGRN